MSRPPKPRVGGAPGFVSTVSLHKAMTRSGLPGASFLNGHGFHVSAWADDANEAIRRIAMVRRLRVFVGCESIGFPSRTSRTYSSRSAR